MKIHFDAIIKLYTVHAYWILNNTFGFLRIGGRIFTEKFGNKDDSLVEMGANYFHGLALTSSMVTLANRFGLLNFSEDRLGSK